MTSNLTSVSLYKQRPCTSRFTSLYKQIYSCTSASKIAHEHEFPKIVQVDLCPCTVLDKLCSWASRFVSLYKQLAGTGCAAFFAEWQCICNPNLVVLTSWLISSSMLGLSIQLVQALVRHTLCIYIYLCNFVFCARSLISCRLAYSLDFYEESNHLWLRTCLRMPLCTVCIYTILFPKLLLLSGCS